MASTTLNSESCGVRQAGGGRAWRGRPSSVATGVEAKTVTTSNPVVTGLSIETIFLNQAG